MNNDSSPAWMHGFPPTPEQRIRFGDGSYMAHPQTRWSYSNMEQLVPTKAVWRGTAATHELEFADELFNDGTGPGIETLDRRTLTFDEAVAESDTDAVAVLHKGRLVYERYFGFCGPHLRHTMMSCNKSMVGTLAECLIHDGVLDDTALVPTIIPELANAAWTDATVRQVLDMVIAMEFHEDYMDQTSDVWRFLRSSGMIPAPPGHDEALCDVLPSIAKAGPHGQAFAYREPNIFVLGWIVRRAAGTDIATLASEKIWQHLGSEHDWLYMVDSSGAETTALATLRDFVRFGQLIANGGRVADQQVLPAAVVQSIHRGGDTDVFAAGDRKVPDTWSYRSHWWYRHLPDRICPVARGAQGQLLVVDPTNDLVIARYASPPMQPPEAFDNLWWPIVDAITDAVIRSDQSAS